MRAKQPEDAEYLINLMKLHGVEPNIVTWNTLAVGYARMNMIPQAIKAMRRLEAAGHTADDWTMIAFNAIRDKHRAVKLMEATVEANKARMAEAAAKKEEERQAAAEADKELMVLSVEERQTMWLQSKKQQAQLERELERDLDAMAEKVPETEQLSETEQLPDMEEMPEEEVAPNSAEEEAYLDDLIQQWSDKPTMALNYIRPNVMSQRTSQTLYRNVINKLRASSSSDPPGADPRRHDLKAWEAVRVRGLQAVPRQPPRRVEAGENDGVSQNELRKRLHDNAPWMMVSDADLDSVGIRVKPGPELRAESRRRKEEDRPVYLRKPLKSGRFS